MHLIIRKNKNTLYLYNLKSGQISTEGYINKSVECMLKIYTVHPRLSILPSMSFIIMVIRRDQNINAYQHLSWRFQNYSYMLIF